MRRAHRISVVTTVMLTLLLSACAEGTRTSSTAPPSAATADSRLKGSLTVFAAASLTEAFNDYKNALLASNPDLSLTYSFAGSQQLVAQISAGAPADVVATADPESMARLVGADLVEAPSDFASNSLVIVVASRNPKGIKGLADLSRQDLKMVLADPAVPAGRYAKQALGKAKVSVKPVSLELDVKAVLRKVASGEADAGIVYVSDALAAGSSVTGIAIPREHNVVATYPVAAVRGTGRRAAAQAFVDQLLQGPGRDALLAHGFIAA
jgi:molybdate transport system substrate-binding protein